MLNLPDPDKDRKDRKKPSICPECKAELSVSTGRGLCPDCKRMTPLPIGYILSKGPHQGKPVYVASIALEHYLQDMGLDEAYEMIKRDIGKKGFFLVDDKPVKKPI